MDDKHGKLEFEQSEAEHKTRLTKIWCESTFGEHPKLSNRDFDNLAIYRDGITVYLDDLCAKGFDRLIEIGCGDGRYLNYLALRFSSRWKFLLGTDISCPRLNQARERFPDLRFEDGQLLDIQDRHQSDGTIFLAVNVLGNIVPSDLDLFLARLAENRTALVMMSRGLDASLPDFYQPRPKIGYNHNFLRLLERHNLYPIKYQLTYSENILRHAVCTLAAVTQ